MNIIRDTREKHGWNFCFYKDVDIIDQKLPFGDYTTDRLQDKIVIERKATTVEISNNLGRRSARARIYREFDKMVNLEKAYIVCEFSELDVYRFPKKSGLRKHQIAQLRVTGKYIRRLMGEIEREYENIQVIFCDNREEAEYFTYHILKTWEDRLDH